MKNMHKNFLDRIKESIKYQIIICIVLSGVVVTIFLLINNYIALKKAHEYTIVEDINLINHIESMQIDNEILELEGYAFLLNQDSRTSSISLLLREVNNGEEVWLDVEQIDRPDVNFYFDCEYNYEYTGFQAFTKENKLNTDKCYELLINIDYKDSNDNMIRKTVSSNRFLLNSELYAYNPYTFDQPDMHVESELLRKVFTDGLLCFYQEEAGMYVYQYEGKLYWIATEDFEYNENNNTYIPYYIYTTQANQHEILDFIFEQYEYKDQITKPYRVAIQEIQKDYAISYISTGVINVPNNQWLWSKSFHIKDIN